MSPDHSARAPAPVPALVIALAIALTGPAAARAYDNPAWTQPQAPFHIVGDIYYVGSKGLAAYLIASPQGHVLIDGTVAENAPMIEANIRRLGFRLQDVKILLNSHAHHDHAGALAQLKQDTGADLWSSPGDRWALEHGRPRGDNTAGLPPWPPVKVDRLLHDGEVIRLGPIALSTVFTPGHTPGCTSWTMDAVDRGQTYRVIFPCSLTVAGNVLVGNKAYPTIAADYRKTLGRLQAFDGADVVLTAHPEVADVIGRHTAQELGDKDPWGDSGQLGAILGDARAELDRALGKPQPPHVPAAPPPDGTGWRNLIQAGEHFAIQFPAAPARTQGRYDLDGSSSAAARVYTAKRSNVVYRLTVADLPARAVDREAIFRKAVERLSRGGVVRTYAEARIRTVYGRQISVERADGGRAVASVFIGQGRLYEVEASAPGPDGRAASADLVRFQQTLNLY
ncbi:MAG TPA: subclass B3 metallo-beta-lactamase [Caulobacteraceae bacterium]